jgi:hypothetical protein
MYYKILKWLIKLEIPLHIDCKSAKEILQKDIQNIASKNILSIFFYIVSI